MTQTPLTKIVGDVVIGGLSNSHGYPVDKLFKPLVLDLNEVPFRQVPGRLQRCFLGIVQRDTPPTAEDLACERRWRKDPEATCKGRPHTDVEIRDAKDWVQKPPYWVRIHAGGHPECHTSDRVDCHALWRNHKDCYCCAGFPYFQPEQLNAFATTSEAYKPILRAHRGPVTVAMALEREFRMPHGHCWGIGTGKTWWRVDAYGGAVPPDSVYMVPQSKAMLLRVIKLCLGYTS